MSNSVGTPLSPLNEANAMRRTAVVYHQPTPNDRVKADGARSRSVSDSVCSDYGFTPFGNEYEASLSHSESIPADGPNLAKEVTMHLERVNDDNVAMDKGDDDVLIRKKVRSDSMLPSELKKRYKTKIKEVGKSINSNSNNDELKMNVQAMELGTMGNLDGSNKDKDSKKKRRKIGRKWGKRKKKDTNKGHGGSSVDPSSNIIHENREIDNNYFVDNKTHRKQVSLTPNSKSRSSKSGNVLSTPSREYSTSTSVEYPYNTIHAFSDGEDPESVDSKSINFRHDIGSDNENEQNGLKIIKSDDEAVLQQIQSTAIKQPKKQTRSGGMFSRLFSKIQTWTDKNRQAFTGYSQILKTAITQQV